MTHSASFCAEPSKVWTGSGKGGLAVAQMRTTERVTGLRCCQLPFPFTSRRRRRKPPRTPPASTRICLIRQPGRAVTCHIAASCIPPPREKHQRRRPRRPLQHSNHHSHRLAPAPHAEQRPPPPRAHTADSCLPATRVARAQIRPRVQIRRRRGGGGARERSTTQLQAVDGRRSPRLARCGRLSRQRRRRGRGKPAQHPKEGF